MTLRRLKSVPGKPARPHPGVKWVSHIADTAQKLSSRGDTLERWERGMERLSEC